WWKATPRTSPTIRWPASFTWESGFSCEGARSLHPARAAGAAAVRRALVYGPVHRRGFGAARAHDRRIRRAPVADAGAHRLAAAASVRIHLPDGGAAGDAADAEPVVGHQRNRGHAGWHRELLPHRRACSRGGPARRRPQPRG